MGNCSHVLFLRGHLEYFTLPFPLYFINPYDRVKGDMKSVDPIEFKLQLLLRRVDQKSSLFPEKNLLHLHEPVKLPGADLPGKNLVHFPLIGKNYLENTFISHFSSPVT